MGSDFKFALALGTNGIDTHQPRYALVIAANAPLAQGAGYPGAAIIAIALSMNLADQSQQLFVIFLTSAWTML